MTCTHTKYGPRTTKAHNSGRKESPYLPASKKSPPTTYLTYSPSSFVSSPPPQKKTRQFPKNQNPACARYISAEGKTDRQKQERIDMKLEEQMMRLYILQVDGCMGIWIASK